MVVFQIFIHWKISLYLGYSLLKRVQQAVAWLTGPFIHPFSVIQSQIQDKLWPLKNHLWQWFNCKKNIGKTIDNNGSSVKKIIEFNGTLTKTIDHSIVPKYLPSSCSRRSEWQQFLKNWKEKVCQEFNRYVYFWVWTVNVIQGLIKQFSTKGKFLKH